MDGLGGTEPLTYPVLQPFVSTLWAIVGRYVRCGSFIIGADRFRRYNDTWLGVRECVLV